MSFFFRLDQNDTGVSNSNPGIGFTDTPNHSTTGGQNQPRVMTSWMKAAGTSTTLLPMVAYEGNYDAGTNYASPALTALSTYVTMKSRKVLCYNN